MGQDTKRLITGMIVALGVLIAYQFILHRLYPNWNPSATDNPPAQTTAGTQPATAPATTTIAQATTGQATTAATVTPVATTAPTAGVWRARGAEGVPVGVTIGSAGLKDKNYA